MSELEILQKCMRQRDVAEERAEAAKAERDRLREALKTAPEPVSNPSDEYIDDWSVWYWGDRKQALADQPDPAREAGLETGADFPENITEKQLTLCAKAIWAVLHPGAAFIECEVGEKGRETALACLRALSGQPDPVREAERKQDAEACPKCGSMLGGHYSWCSEIAGKSVAGGP